MNTTKKTLVNYVRHLVREVEPIDSPGWDTKWCLLWQVNDRIEVEEGLALDIKGCVEVKVDKVGGNGVIDLSIGFHDTPTFRFVNKALCKEIVDCVKPMFGIVDNPKKKVA